MSASPIQSLSAPVDEQTFKQLANTDRRRAYEFVVRQYRERLFQHALYIVKEPQEAYDAIQEVFIKAMREQRFFDGDFRIKAWLFRVTSNLCYNIVRDRRRRGGILEAMPHESSSRATQVEDIHTGQCRGELQAAMEDLSRDHREILILRYYDDLSYAEIAEVLDVKAGTVMSRLSRARNRLAEKLGADHPVVVDLLQLQVAPT